MIPYSLVLSHAKILDGCGNPWYWGDLAVHQGRIAAIAPPGKLQGERTINLDGRYLAPGIIDIHTHSDLSLMVNRKAESVIRQGVTTHLAGNCGMSPAPMSEAYRDVMVNYWRPTADMPGVDWNWHSFGEYLDAVQTGGIAINFASLAGHGGLRISVMGLENRHPTSAELAQMRVLLQEAMQAGAFGLSTGLVYPPGCFADTDEIIELCKVVHRYNGIYATHIRGERETIMQAVAEAIRIGRETEVPVQVSHNAPKFGALYDASANLGLIDEARSRGQDVTVDNDVHTDLCVSLTGGLPQDIQELPETEIARHLKDPNQRKAIRDEIVRDQRPAFGPVGLLKHGQWQRITMFYAPKTPEVVGKTIETLAREQNKEAFDIYFDLIIANGHEVEAIFDYIDEANIRMLLRHPAVMICSDGAVSAPYGPLGETPEYSPCSYGEFPGVLERYVRDESVLTLQEAIRKMTSFPAARMGLHDRGILKPGMWADMMVFDLSHIHDQATNLFPHTYPFENFPHQYPEGIDYVLVNGVVVVEQGEHTGALPGNVLRHNIG